LLGCFSGDGCFAGCARRQNGDDLDLYCFVAVGLSFGDFSARTEIRLTVVDDFTKYVITGPILAFFVWLAFITAGSTTNNVDSGSGKLNVFAVTNDGPVAGLTVSGTPDSILKLLFPSGC